MTDQKPDRQDDGLLTDINHAAHAAGTNAWVRDVLKRAHRAIRTSRDAAEGAGGTCTYCDYPIKCPRCGRAPSAPKPASDAMRALEAARPYVLKRLLETKEDFERNVLAQIDAALSAPVPPADGAIERIARIIDNEAFEMVALIGKRMDIVHTSQWRSRCDQARAKAIVILSLPPSPAAAAENSTPAAVRSQDTPRPPASAAMGLSAGVEAVAAEPVAWRWRRKAYDQWPAGPWELRHSAFKDDLFDVEPLYAALPVRGDREAMVRDLINFVSSIRQKFIDPETRNDLLNKIGSYSIPVTPA